MRSFIWGNLLTFTAGDGYSISSAVSLVFQNFGASLWPRYWPNKTHQFVQQEDLQGCRTDKHEDRAGLEASTLGNTINWHAEASAADCGRIAEGGGAGWPK